MAIKLLYAAAVGLLALMSAFNQVKAMGLSWQEVHYVDRLEAAVEGEAGIPSQLRVLSDRSLLGFIRAAQVLGLPRPEGLVMVGVRVAQNVLLLGMALWLYQCLGLSSYLSLLGVSALAWSMTQTNLHADLSVSLYSEVIFYLAAGILVLRDRGGMLPVLTAAAALNRETALFLPLLPAMAGLLHPAGSEARRYLRGISLLCVSAYCLVQAPLWFMAQGCSWDPHWSHTMPGPPRLWFNLTHEQTWGRLASTLGAAPLLMLWGWKDLPKLLRGWAVLLVPAWFGLHFYFGAAMETRLFLTPLALVLIPGALFLVHNAIETQARRAPTANAHAIR